MGNKRIGKVVNKLQLVLGFMIGAQLFFLIISHFVFNFVVNADGNLDNDGINKVKIVFLLLYGIIIISVDVYFYVKKILGMKSFIGLKPIECTVEDYVIRKYNTGNQREYEVKLLVKSLADGKYYFTFDKYSYCYFTHIFSSNAHKINNVLVVREDKSVVNVGDRAYMYIKKRINVKVEKNNNSVVINKLKYDLMNLNNADVFDNVVFFEGMIEVNEM